MKSIKRFLDLFERLVSQYELNSGRAFMARIESEPVAPGLYHASDMDLVESFNRRKEQLRRENKSPEDSYGDDIFDYDWSAFEPGRYSG